MVIRMQAKGAGTSVVARELALDVADCLYTPAIGEHVPGVANKLADYLSRLDDHVDEPIPGPLRNVSWSEVSYRSEQ